jgi:hypothetical protein
MSPYAFKIPQSFVGAFTIRRLMLQSLLYLALVSLVLELASTDCAVPASAPVGHQ